MFEALKLIQLASRLTGAERKAFRDALGAATAALPGARRALLEPVCPGGYGAGDFIWRVAFPDAAAARCALEGRPWQASGAALLGDQARVERIEHAAWQSAGGGGRSPPEGGAYRVALFCANRAPSAERLARFAAETVAMPRYIRSIRSWQLAAACEAGGSRPWTHVWEQEYDELAGLTGTYMMHPYHWGHVDRWFDPEWPEWLVDPVLCHAFCATTAPVIEPAPMERDCLNGEARAARRR